MILPMSIVASSILNVTIFEKTDSSFSLISDFVIFVPIEGTYNVLSNDDQIFKIRKVVVSNMIEKRFGRIILFSKFRV